MNIFLRIIFDGGCAKQLLQFHHWFVFGVPPSLYGQKGLCDLIAMRDGTVVFIEVKSPKGRQTMDQKILQQRIEEAGGAYILARSVEDVKGFLMWKRRHAFNSR